MSISFNTIPGSGLVAPLLGAFEVNSAGAYTGNSRMLLVAHATASGQIAADTPTLIASQLEADRLGGAGSMLREMFRIARQNAPVQEIWAVAPAEVGAAGAWTLTVGSAAVGTAGTAYVDIAGERLAFSVSASDTTTTIAAAIAAAVNGWYNALTGAQLPVTASAVSAVVTLTCRHKGALFADLDVYLPSIAGSNLLAATSAVTVAQSVVATGVPTLTNSLAAMLDNQFDLILCPWSDSASLAALTTALNDTSGRWAWSRQSYGHAFTVFEGTISAATTFGLAGNDRHVTTIVRPAAAPQPAHLWLAGMVARVAPWLADYTNGSVSRNQAALVVQGLAPPRDQTTWYGWATRNTFVQSGLSTWKVDDSGNVVIDKLVTMNRLGPQSQPDLTFRDVQTMFQLMHALRRIRNDIANEHGNKALAKRNPGSNAAIATPADIAGTIVGSLHALEVAGIVQNATGTAKALKVEIDASTPTRVNVFLPIENVHPLDVLAGNAMLYALGLPKAA